MRMSHTTRPSHTTPTPAETAAVRALLAREGLARTQQILGIGRHTVQRVRAGCLPVHHGTMIAVRVALRLHNQMERQP